MRLKSNGQHLEGNSASCPFLQEQCGCGQVLLPMHWHELTVPRALLVVSGTAFPLAVAVHTTGAQGTGEQVGGARRHEVTDCGGNVHSLVRHWKEGARRVTREHLLL